MDLLRPLSPKQVENLKRLFDVDFTYNSTAIEGNTYSLQETRVVLLDGITVGGKSTREHLEIVNHKEAIDYIENLAKKEPSGFTRTDILNIHNLIMNLVLINYGYPPAIIKVSHKAQYLDAIESWQQNSDDLPFKRLFIDSVRESLEVYLDTLQNNIIWK